MAELRLDQDLTREEWIEAMRIDFITFARFAFNAIQPGVQFERNWHIDAIGEHLEAMLRGEIKRLIINMPPRSLKSYLCSQSWPAWVLGKDPCDKFINVSYGGTVVENNAIGCRSIINWKEYANIFPGMKIQNMDRILHFKTSEGGHYYADTALSTITGIGCNWMIIDDPIKPMEALSDTVRKTTNENIRSTLLNRFDDRRISKLLMVMQRLHEQDPTGDLLSTDKSIVHLKLPGETKTQIVVNLETPPESPCVSRQWIMPAGGLLFPARLSRESLDQLQLDMNPYHYAGQILQEPVPIGGGEFKDNWVQFYEGGAANVRTMNVVILVDPAGGDELNKKKKKTTDYTAMMVVGLAPDNNYYLLDIVRERLNPTDRIDTLFTLHRKWNQLCGKPPKVGYEKYGLMSDTHYINVKKKQETYNFPLITLGGALSKEERIRRLVPDMQNNRWYFPANLIYVDNEGRRFDLVHELIHSEMATFPNGRFDDMLDALARVYEKELFMVFPKLTQKIDSNIHSSGTDDHEPDSWRRF